MAKDIWLSLPVRDMKRSREFFANLGCGFTDPDGHRLNALYMDRSKMPAHK